MLHLHRTPARGALLLVIALLATSTVCMAQPDERVVDFSRPGRATMKIYLWGNVSQPGIWKVENDVDFLELLTTAQVPSVGQNNYQTKDKTVVRVYRGRVSRRTEVYAAEVKELLQNGSAYPALQDGDIIYLETTTKQRFGLNTFLSAVGAASAVVLLAIRLGNL